MAAESAAARLRDSIAEMPRALSWPWIAEDGIVLARLQDDVRVRVNPQLPGWDDATNAAVTRHIALCASPDVAAAVAETSTEADSCHLRLEVTPMRWTQRLGMLRAATLLDEHDFMEA